MTQRVSRRLIAVPGVVAMIALVGAMCSRSIVMPVYIPGVGVANGLLSFWSLLPWACTLAALLILIGSMVPVAVPRGDVWVIPLVTATAVLTLAALMWVDWSLNNSRRSAVPMLMMFSCVGVALIIQAIMTRAWRGAALP